MNLISEQATLMSIVNSLAGSHQQDPSQVSPRELLLVQHCQWQNKIWISHAIEPASTPNDNDRDVVGDNPDIFISVTLVIVAHFLT